MFRVTIVNAKGGSGKTTLATNIASYYCNKNLKTTLIDYDSQGSSSYWAQRRSDSKPAINVIAAYKQAINVTRSWFLRPPRDTDRVIIDSPSGLDLSEFASTLRESDVIIIPILPSTIDIHAVSKFIAQLLLKVDNKRKQGRIAVVANRCRKNTLISKQLEKFLHSLGIPFITTLRDSQLYIKASEAGLGIFELAKTNPKDLESWQPLIQWLESCEKESLIEQKPPYTGTTADTGLNSIAKEKQHMQLIGMKPT